MEYSKISGLCVASSIAFNNGGDETTKNPKQYILLKKGQITFFILDFYVCIMGSRDETLMTIQGHD